MAKNPIEGSQRVSKNLNSKGPRRTAPRAMPHSGIGGRKPSKRSGK